MHSYSSPPGFTGQDSRGTDATSNALGVLAVARHAITAIICEAEWELSPRHSGTDGAIPLVACEAQVACKLMRSFRRLPIEENDGTMPVARSQDVAGSSGYGYSQIAREGRCHVGSESAP